MATNTNAPSVSFVLEATRAINAWQMRRLNLVQSIAEKTLANLIYTPAMDIDSLSNDLDKLLFNDLNPHMSDVSDSNTIIFNRGDNDDDDYGGDDDEEKSSIEHLTIPSAQPPRYLIRAPSEEMSIDSAATSRKGQAITIKQTPHAYYPCYSDSSNGVMAFNGDELVYVDWVWKEDKITGRYKVRMINTKTTNLPNDNQRQQNFRSILCPRELNSTRFVDIDYAPYMSKYMMALVERISPDEQVPMARKSLIYLFNSSEETFEPWASFCEGSDQMGLVTRLCCCHNQPIVYLIMNVFGQSDLIILKSDGTLHDRKTTEDLFLPLSNARIVDIACTANNDRIALAFNSTTNQSSGETGVCLVDPRKWIRIASINLDQTNIPFTLPRLTWIENQALFGLIDQDAQLLVFNRDGNALGTRSFLCPVKNQGDHLYPRNICAPQSHWVAIRYDRVITIHRVLD